MRSDNLGHQSFAEEDNIKAYLRILLYEDEEWTCLAQNVDQWWVLLNIRIFQVPYDKLG
jgi:hypothetical protein